MFAALKYLLGGPAHRSRHLGLAMACLLAALGVAFVTVGAFGGGQDLSPPPGHATPTVSHPQHRNDSDAGGRHATAIRRVPSEGGNDADQAGHARPVEFSIPAIDAGSRLLRLGLQPDGTMEVPLPRQADQAGWYEYSPAPGQRGPAVIVGHIDSLDDGRGVFYHLADLKPGDEVRVRRDDGLIAIFAVDKVAAYPQDAFPTRMVYGDIDHAGLRLITCGGFSTATGQYETNTVVFASLVRTKHADPR